VDLVDRESHQGCIDRSCAPTMDQPAVNRSPIEAQEGDVASPHARHVSGPERAQPGPSLALPRPSHGPVLVDC
jgi:hypothetical protein